MIDLIFILLFSLTQDRVPARLLLEPGNERSPILFP